MPADPYEGVAPQPWVTVTPRAPTVPEGVNTIRKPGIRVFDTSPSFFTLPPAIPPVGSYPAMTELGNEFWSMPEYFREIGPAPSAWLYSDPTYNPEILGSYPMSTFGQQGMYTMPNYFE